MLLKDVLKIVATENNDALMIVFYVHILKFWSSL